MAAALAGDDLARSLSSRSFASDSHRSWVAAASFREAWNAPSGVFNQSKRQDDEEELRWAAIERLPTYDRLRKGVIRQVLDNGKVVHGEVDVTNLGIQDKKLLMESILKVVEEDNEKFLRRLRDRTDRVGIEVPKIEVRYEHLSVEGDVHVGSRALPSLINFYMNAIESVLGFVHLIPHNKRKIQILNDVSGVVRPSRMTLLLGPPASGKTTLMLALAGKLSDDLRTSGKVTYCGHELTEFMPQRTCAYISQHDLHYGEMTVRETLDFSGRCLGVGTRYELLAELSRREKEAGIKPDPEIDAFMKATAVVGQETSLVTDYVLKILGLDICADTMVGDDMRRGISGGQKKRVTTGEMLVGPAKFLLMDEISTGLDSSTTFQICKFMKQMVHVMDVTMAISLLQPAPETYNLFDDIILLSEGQVVYQGPLENVLEFFEYMGFKCPDRKGVADFLQEVTSKKDQEQYWFKKNQPYRYVSVSDFGQGFSSFHIGQQISSELRVPYDKSKAHPAALVTEKYGISNWELFKACFAREWLLMKRSGFVFIFKIVQITIMSIIAFTVFLRTEMKAGTAEGGQKFYGALFFSLINVMFNGMAELVMTIFRLPVFFKQRDHMFYPAWAFGLPIWLLKIPLSFLESTIWIVITYYTIGFAPSASRFFRQFIAFFGIHQMALSLFRFIAALGRVEVIANTLGTFTLLLVFVLGGFIVAKDDIQPWMIWGYYISPMMYGQNAIVMNEFLDKRWDTPNIDPSINATTIGEVLLKARGFFTEDYLFWVCIGALFGFSILFNILFIAALTFLNPIGDSKSTVVEENGDKKKKNRAFGQHGTEGIDMAMRNPDEIVGASEHAPKKGMVLPFHPLSLTFNHVNYYVDMPVEMKGQGVEEDRLQLLRNVSGAFRPGILTALVGVSGAGKTTLMDVLAGRKTKGYIEGSINISGYPKNQATFARVSATWMLEITAPSVEAQLNVDFTEIFANSALYQRNQELIKELSSPAPGSKDLYFPTKYPQSFLTQCNACFWKQQRSYWRHSKYNVVRFVITTCIAILFGLIFWNMGHKMSKQQDLFNLLGAMYSVVFFLGAGNANAVQPVVSVERIVFYRERGAGMYSALPYAFAQVAIEQIPVWWRWYYWGSPVAWTLYGVLVSQVGDKDTPLQMLGLANTNITISGYLKDSFGMKHDFLPYVAVAHVGWVLLFLFLFAYGIKFLNFQRR
ncbi:hypothetical protein Q3G72_029428 [Acer saccharum]|nr:hypothetical protein Q3G72_029428 [Acer saccharum]